MTNPSLIRLRWLAALAALSPPGVGAGEPGPGHVTLVRPDGTRITGRLQPGPSAEPEFRADSSEIPTRLEVGSVVRFETPAVPSALAVPPFRARLGNGQQVSGRLVELGPTELRLTDTISEAPLTLARAGVQALIQRSGETVAFQDGFETLDATRWAIVGEPELTDGPRAAGEHSLKVPAGGASLTHRVERPFPSGRLDLSFHDGGEVVPGQQWWVDLTFRGSAGPETVRAVLGWAEDSLGVESPGGPALAVQRLTRKPGWHRLTCRFDPDRCEVAVDGNELALGKGLHGPLAEVRLASYQALKVAPPAGLAGHLDDLRLVRFDEPVGGLEVDATQDEARLVTGDQLFGKVLRARPEGVTLSVDGQETSLGWGEVSGLDFRRTAAPGRPVSGLLVRAEWLSGPGADPKDRNALDGALAAWDDKQLSLATPYAGTLDIPRDRLLSLRVLGRGLRIELDPKAHHLGNEISVLEPALDPPQPEGAALELTFDLADPPDASAFLVLDVVQVVGEANDLPFAMLVKKGELRTNVKLNGIPFDYLNRHVTTKNEAPERLRLPVPKTLLKRGKNVLRLEQMGTANDPNYLDDLGVLGIALEFATVAPGGSPR